MELIGELEQIPAALKDLVSFYAGPGKQDLQLPVPQQVLLTGMGASFHASAIGAFMFQHAGIASCALDASDILFSSSYNLQPFQSIIYISQSGSSGEIKPFIEKCPDPRRLIGITNSAASLLAHKAGQVLPMVAGDEAWIASKTYVNSLAILWLLAKSWSRQDPAEGLESLLLVADHIARLQQNIVDALAYLEEAFATAHRVVFLGHGPHAVTARQASMTLSEWPKLTSQSYSLGAFRHGFIETVDAHTAVFIVAPPGPTQPSALALAEELTGYGAPVTLIENGVLHAPGQPARPAPCPHELLSPILDIIPIQLFAEASARKRLDQPGFRYISKVVSRL